MIIKNIDNKVTLVVCLMLVTLVLPVITNAQSFLSHRAARCYESLAYSRAAELYEKLRAKDEKNGEYVQKLAYSYNKMLSYKKALHYYELLVRTDKYKPSDLYDYSQLLLNEGDITGSKVWMEKYLIKVPTDIKAKNQLEEISKGKHSRLVGVDISIQNMKSNTRFIDMSATFFKDQIVYSSARDSFSVIKTIYDWNNQPYLDLYVSKQGLQPEDKDDKSVFKMVNSWYHEGPVCFSSDYNTMYFTRNNYFNGHVTTMPDGTNNLKIFTAQFDGRKWAQIREFPFNSNRYSVGHPALSPDNKTLYFISDMPGGYGETDIYKSEFVNGIWSKPVNLGENINTSGKEMFPYIDKNGNLYFSSNGHPGNGGLDMYVAENMNTGEYKVINLAAPLNSTYDDFGLVFNTDSLSGYFTSNRPGGKGDDDNYSFKVNKIELRVHALESVTKRMLSGTKVSLLNTKGKVEDSGIAGKDGIVNFSVGADQKYQILAENSSYNSEEIHAKIKGSLVNYIQDEDVFLKQSLPYLTIEIIDKESGLIIPNALVDVSQGKYDEADLEDSNGIIRMKLNAETDYSFYVSAEAYFDKTVKFSSVGKSPGEYTMTVELEKLSTGKQFVLEDLYYDLDKYNIRPDAAQVLDNLARILIDNPAVRIEIGSHTDSRASAVYNLDLSQKRSESVVDYLVSKGISRNRLVAKGYGETKLINKCADGVPCSELEHQANRRTVIEILNEDVLKVKRGAKNIYYF